MRTLLSHVVNRRFSQDSEDVATEALAFIIQKSEAARNGVMRVLHTVNPDLPHLWFKTQQTERGVRPDMSGMSGNRPFVFIDIKFWAGLTDSQPVEYLKLLSEHSESSVLLVVVPEARQDTMWREIINRLEDADISTRAAGRPGRAVVRAVQTDLGPHVALTSWTELLSVIEAEVADEPHTRDDVVHLRDLCHSADSDAFVPLSASDLTDQRVPAFIMQLVKVVNGAVNAALAKGFLSVEGLRPAHSWVRVGRYVLFVERGGFGAWFGISLERWHGHGSTPLWVEFNDTEWGRGSEASEVRP